MMNADKKVDGIYVVHGITGYEEREVMINDLFQKHGLQHEFVKESEYEDQNNKWIKQYFVEDIRRKLSKGALYCTLVHLRCYERILEAGNKFAIVFENDICFLKNFNQHLDAVIKEAQQLPSGFMVSLENSTLRFPSYKKTRKGKYLYEAHFGRCAGAYLIDLKGVQHIMEYVKHHKCDKVIDWWHNDLIKENLIKMYWAHPPLTEQGSMNGRLPSTISKRTRGNLRSIKWELQKFYKMRILRMFR